MQLTLHPPALGTDDVVVGSPAASPRFGMAMMASGVQPTPSVHVVTTTLASSQSELPELGPAQHVQVNGYGAQLFRRQKGRCR